MTNNIYNGWLNGYMVQFITEKPRLRTIIYNTCSMPYSLTFILIDSLCSNLKCRWKTELLSNCKEHWKQKHSFLQTFIFGNFSQIVNTTVIYLLLLYLIDTEYNFLLWITKPIKNTSSAYLFTKVVSCFWKSLSFYADL